ncbi:uncharacterized protein C18orf25 homolog isoform X2 [Latimeria chalumnae]|uniref:uncharacterized protein C18orf25 homolog isoform X2 n=1 Tax=Latimeria chalumnae TaxID=7897 RepID=UPI0003C1AB0E|nr:PREDICTED: uncharacterized protein C18orf25 homolog isoform X2 [Latimeria chalumnae]|eukprot:XP_006011290.1 PREDICTED: uncharacterized protein C18orf25 homolog isoform X2 [Latimeria chalumnae]
MTMEAVGKAEELVDSDLPPKSSEGSGQTEEGPLEPMGSSQKDENHMLVATADADSGMLSTMPCLLMELRRDSSESQLASTESDKPSAGRAYESDSSNHCMLSPSSSGHLADSDTLSSADERGPSRADPADAAGEGAGSAGGRKSRRSRSESETSTMAAKKNRQSSEKQNGKVKVHRSQKHKERIRLLRQKREAAARKKYNLLQDSSTSDSDLTCDSSTSSSEDEEEVSGSSKTITAEIPAGLGRTAADGSSGATKDLPGLLDRAAAWDRNCIGSVLEEAMNCFAEMQRQTEERFRVWMEKLTRLDTDEDTKQQQQQQQQSEVRDPKMQMAGQRIPPGGEGQPNPFTHMPNGQLPTPQMYAPYVGYQSLDTPSSLAMTLNNNNLLDSIPENGNPAVPDLDRSHI